MGQIVEESQESKLIHDNLYSSKVILYNDDYNSFDHVILCVMKICHKSRSESMKITMTAHNTGKSVCFTGSMESCETVAEKMGSKNLTVSIE
ncbi:MAG: ATP-dependent Clp protease adaptor ClpS [Leptospiraceae bacterium]|nr:ATP-dependent Clp protease adaptor ClpS [Leptospiraceae bacterium]